MPPRPKSDKPQITALQIGGSDPNVVVDLAVPGEYPEEYSEESDVWRKGYDIAARNKNTPKACIVFANNYQGETISGVELEEEIKRLQDLQVKRRGSTS